MKPSNKGITFYMDMIRLYDWDVDQLEEITELTGAFAEFLNHEEMIEELKVYGVEL